MSGPSDDLDPLLRNQRLANEDAQARMVKGAVRDRLFGGPRSGPTRVDGYELVECIGIGAMGKVFLAKAEDGTDVAIKLLRPLPWLADDKARRRLRREARALSRIDHPNVVGVRDVGQTEEDGVYIVMEHVRGDTLRAWLAARERTNAEVLRVLHDAAVGLHAAHEAGVLHRDLKPDNILVGDDGIVRVADFGFARFMGDRGASPDSLADSLTTAGAVGTPAYLAPEYRRGDPPTIACDVFSFAVTAWEALTGARPTDKDGTVELGTSGDALAPELREVLVAGMRAEAGERPAGIETLARALRGTLDRSRGIGRRWVLGGAVGVALAGVGVWWATRHDGGAREPAPNGPTADANAPARTTVSPDAASLRASVGVDATMDPTATVPGWARQIRRNADAPQAIDAWSIPVVSIAVADDSTVGERAAAAATVARAQGLGRVEIDPIAVTDMTGWASLAAPLHADDATLIVGGLPHATEGTWAQRVTGDLGRVRGWAARHNDGRFPAGVVSLAVDTPATDATAAALRRGAAEVTAYRDEHLPRLGLWAVLSPGREADVLDAWLQLWAAGFSRVFVPAGEAYDSVVALLTAAGSLRAGGSVTSGDHDARIVRLVDDDGVAKMLVVWRRDAAAASVRVPVGDARAHAVEDGTALPVTAGSATVSVASTPVLLELR